MMRSNRRSMGPASVSWLRGRLSAATVFLAFGLVGLVSCSPPPEETVDINGTQVPARIKIATANVGGSYYPVGTAIAQVLTDNLDGVVAAAENSGGSNQNIRMLDQNQVHLAMGNAAITYPAIQGIDTFEKPFPVRAVISLHGSINVVVALKSSGITTIQDLAGKRVSVGPPGGGWDYYVRPILAAHGVDYSDFQQRYENQANAMESLTDGVFDAVVVGGTVPHATILSASTTHELAYVGFDPDAIEQVSAAYPFIKPFVIPAGTYEGLSEDLLAVDSGTAQILVREDADPDYVYLITKTIYENRAKIAEMHPAGAEITPERAAMDIGIPYHEGSLRYFKEMGLWHPREGFVEN